MSRVAIVGGTRTPFVKASGALGGYSFIELGAHVLKAIVAKLQLQPEEIDEFAFSTVLLDGRAPNFAREVVFKAGLSPRICAHSISNNCISGLVALTYLSDAIKSGRIKIAVGGGAESMSRPALAWSPGAERFFLQLSRARSIGERLRILTEFRPSFLMPLPPSPKEPSTGLTMGQHCELTNKEFSISRSTQDELAYLSHQRAAKAQKEGILASEIAPLGNVKDDNLIRPDTTVARLSKLQPVFDTSGSGTLTAGNSSALTDGASVVCLMEEQVARAQGREILAFLEMSVFKAINPNHGLLMAPALALPELMQRAGLQVKDVDIFEVHEAFAAQVLANRIVWKDGWSLYPELKAIGEIPEERLNVNGGSLALGHPFAATGGRLILSAANELKRRQGKRAVISVCAAGAMAGAVLLTRE